MTAQAKRLGPLCPISGESLPEEIANAITHGLGVILSLVGLVAIIIAACHSGSAWHVVSCSIYGTCLLLLYTVSTLYHSFPHSKTKRVFKVLDHAFIYLLIAGSYTPYTFGPLRGAWGWSLFGVVWGVALVGMPLKAFIGNKCSMLSIVPYIVLGWLAVLAANPLCHNMGKGGFVWLIAGGVAYSVGALLYLVERMPFNHAIWHLFVLAGSICHYVSIIHYVVI